MATVPVSSCRHDTVVISPAVWVCTGRGGNPFYLIRDWAHRTAGGHSCGKRPKLKSVCGNWIGPDVKSGPDPYITRHGSTVDCNWSIYVDRPWAPAAL